MYYAQLRTFNNSLLEVEDAYQRDLRGVEAQHQSKESYAQVLEKEMAVALRELQGLVAEGRGAVGKQLQRSQHLVAVNSGSLMQGLAELEGQAKAALRDNLTTIHQSFDDAASLLSVMEQVSLTDSVLAAVLTEATSASRAFDDSRGSHTVAREQTSNYLHKVIFQAISNNSADFQMVSNFISPGATVSRGGGGGGNRVAHASGRGRRGSDGTESESQQEAGASAGGGGGVSRLRLELARLYRLSFSPQLHGGIHSSTGAAGGEHWVGDAAAGQTLQLYGAHQAPGAVASSGGGYERVFTLISPEGLQALLQGGWMALPTSQIFSPDSGR